MGGRISWTDCRCLQPIGTSPQGCPSEGGYFSGKRLPKHTSNVLWLTAVRCRISSSLLIPARRILISLASQSRPARYIPLRLPSFSGVPRFRPLYQCCSNGRSDTLANSAPGCSHLSAQLKAPCHPQLPECRTAWSQSHWPPQCKALTRCPSRLLNDHNLAGRHREGASLVWTQQSNLSRSMSRRVE